VLHPASKQGHDGAMHLLLDAGVGGVHLAAAVVDGTRPVSTEYSYLGRILTVYWPDLDRISLAGRTLQLPLTWRDRISTVYSYLGHTLTVS
jgi:hypothetical protein